MRAGGRSDGTAGGGREAGRKVAATFGAVVRPIQEFFRLEAASGILLFAAAVVALIWANSPAQDAYHRFFGAPVTLGLGANTLRVSLAQVINEGLMTVFFFVVGMEIKRELAIGELRTWRQAALPAIGAVGGMVVPSLIYLIFNWGGPGQPGWGIPIATDIAFCVGCLTFLRSRVPYALVIFLTALAIFDDIGGILVIACFYGGGLEVGWLLGSAGVFGVLYAMNRAYVRNGLAYLLGGAALWFTLHHGGIHATIAGAVLGMMIPVRPRRPAREVLRGLGDHVGELLRVHRSEELDEASVLQIEEKLEDLEVPLYRFVHNLHRYVAFGIMPLFALANSGVSLEGRGVAEAGGSIALGTALGLLIGKPVGIMAATAIAVRAGLRRPGGASWPLLAGVSVVAGIGFTVSLFIAGLAFAGDGNLLDQAKLGILLGSGAAGMVGILALRLAPPVAAVTSETVAEPDESAAE